ncbi:AP-3 complex subunit beta [Ceratocystis pirilliformis]|uniref:AP-3 complex subunit beta n=1 Tax=Ceratocystis pirilliformis TaxID=259994 RepID=A0ABR3YM04_9PEZI
MESIARISSLLESARDLTLDAAQSSRLNPRFSRPLDHSQIKKLLDSRSDRDVLDGLRRVLEMMYRNQQTLPFFSSIVKNVASPNLEIKKLVYIYTVHHAEQDPDVALLSINTIQKSLSDSNPQVRALALKTMSAIRVPVISQIVTLAIKKGVADMSPFVRRAAALAIPKCYRLNPSQLPSLLEYMSTLLADKYYVAGAAVMAFLEICPERIDLIHKHYRSLVRKIIDMDDWSQIATIRMLTFYARKCFPKRTRRVQRKGAKTSSYTTPPNDLQDFYGEPDSGETTPSQDGDTEEVILDKDLELLLSSITPLLHSRSSGVILAVTRCFVDIGTPEYVSQAIGPLVSLLRSSVDIQQVAMYNIVTVCLSRPQDFVRYSSHFLVRATDPVPVWELKLEVLTLIFPHSPSHTKGLILNELEHFARGTCNKILQREAVRAIGRCAQSDPQTAARCLRLLLSQITSLDGTLASESLTVIRHLIQQDPKSHTNTVIRLARNLDSATEPQARATIIWLVGEFSGLGGEDNIAPDVLRILLKSFATESEDAKRQIVLLAAKVYLHYINSKNDMQKEPPSSLTTRNDTDSEDDHPIAQLWRYVAALVRYDTSYDLRDRARMCWSLIGVPQLATLLLLAPKPAPQAPSPSDSRKGLRLGSSTLVLGGVGGIHGIRSYEAMPDWVSDGAEPSPSLRDSEETSSVSSAMAYSADTEKRVLTAAERLSEASRSTSLGVPLSKMAGSEPGAFSNGGERGSASGTGEKSLDDWLAESESEKEDEGEEGEDGDEDEDEESDDEESEEDDDDEDDDDDDGEDEESSDADSENARLMH